MARPFGSKNRVARVATRDKKRIVAVMQGARIGRAFVDGFRPDGDGRIGGTSARNARRVLQRSMERIGAMTEEERQRLVSLPAPPAPGSRMREALDLRAAGTPYSEIADELGVALSMAFELVARGVERLTGEGVRNGDLARQMQLVRLDALLHARWQQALDGDARAGDLCMKILERQARLLGLDGPMKVDITYRLRLLAEQEGLDPDEVIAEAQAIIKRLPK
jgi:hypothetical protein